MKKVFCLLMSIIFLFSNLLFISFAHSGRTDASGGHRDNKNKSGLGSYHYHCGGNPAHLHPNGVCPYKTSKATTSNSTTNSSPSTKSRTTAPNNQTNTQNSTSLKQQIIIVEKSTVYDKSSTASEKLASVKEGYTFTPIGETKSYWKMQFKKKDDDNTYQGYILKTDTKEK